MGRRGILVFLALLLVFALTMPAAFAADPTEKFHDMQIDVFTGDMMGMAVEDLLTPIWREKTRVTANCFGPQALTSDQYIQMQMVADTLPELICTHELSNEARDALISAGMVYEVTDEMIRTYLPNYVQRYETELGLELDNLYFANQWEDGKQYYLTYEFRDVVFPALRGNLRSAASGVDTPYSWYLRDDILKMIFPDARSEAELLELYRANGGKLTLEEALGDIPINNMEDMYHYLQQVKELGIKIGDKDVIPGQLTYTSSVGATLWSLQTAAGAFWQNGFGYKDDQMNHIQTSDQFKEYIRWYNTFNAEGLIDREAWIMMHDQVVAKVVNGEFAVFNYWLPVNDARQLAKDEGRGYGYRILPAFMIPLNNELQNLENRPIAFGGYTKIFLTKSIKEEDLPQVLYWLDWNLSDEAAILRHWGTPNMTTGEGDDRRFTEEFKDVENSAVYGIRGGKDTAYYGLSNDLDNNYFMNYETMKIYQCGNYYTPRWVYPVDPEQTTNLDSYIFNLIREYYGAQTNFYNQIGWSYEQLTEDPEYKEVMAEYASVESDGLLAQAMVCPPDQFDAMYQIYFDKTYPQPLLDQYKRLNDMWKEIYDTYCVPEIEKALELRSDYN